MGVLWGGEVHAFKVYSDHSRAECFECGQIMNDTPRDDDYPLGRGRYSQYCSRCDLRTWYDIQEGGEHEDKN